MKRYFTPILSIRLFSSGDIVCASVDDEQNYNDTVVTDRFDD